MTHKEYCIEIYNKKYQDFLTALKVKDDIAREREAQRLSIRDTTIEAMNKFPYVDTSEIWKCIYEAHVARKSNLKIPYSQIEQVISADNSWKKSSGHAFEEMILLLANPQLKKHKIRLCLQREISELINENKIKNETPDLAWLNNSLQQSDFDIYATVSQDDGSLLIFGCLQSKTSIRDRVTRDREPSANAMAKFYWSVAVVLDGDFLRLPKFRAMAEGGTTSYEHNGWHGMYVFSKIVEGPLIFQLNNKLEPFVSHAVQAKDQWLKQRQWFNDKWRPNEG